ncbi:MAG: PQQ-like beta-propeller repeat protein [Rhodobacteraceae bacterium]|nr:PQQ-like beta-propeller repeat protein [Paracoccaceae bacterium]
MGKSNLWSMGRLGLGVCVLAALAACGERDTTLQGDREALGISGAGQQVQSDRTVPISLPDPQSLANWTHPGGNERHTAPHAAFSSAPQLAWSASIGAGDNRRKRINAFPVVADGRVFTVDSEGAVTSTSTAGQTLWSVDLTPSHEGRGQGGSHGLAYGGGALYVNTGFGEVVALDPATGGEVWSQDIDAQGGGSATYFDGRVYVAARDSVGWAIDAETGRVQWQLSGTPSGAGYVGGAGPAVTNDLAVFPFPSGELLAVFRRGGVQRWTATVLGGRPGVAYSAITDVAAEPVIVGGRVYAANPAGRLVALDLANGERLWTARSGSLKAPVVSGGSVFIVSDQNALTRLDANTGEVIWTTELDLFAEERERRRKTIIGHFGPVLAGGRLWVASTDGNLRGFDPASGTQVASIAMPGEAATPPVVAGGAMYIVTTRGQLIAFR